MGLNVVAVADLFRTPMAAAALLLLGAAGAPAAGQGTEPKGLDILESPRRQARAAILREDFRVARLVYDHQDEVGHINYGEATPGLVCDGVLTEAAARNLSWDEGPANRFAAAYNATLVGDRRYPDPDVCIVIDRRLQGSRWPDFGRIAAQPLHPERSVNRAARAGRPQLVRALIASGKPFDAHDRWNRRPLHWAARRGDVASIKILLAAGAKIDQPEPGSPLLLAVDGNHGEAVDLLLEAGASVHCGETDARHSWGSSTGGGAQLCPLRHAIEQEYLHSVSSIVRKMAAHPPDPDRGELVGALHRALETGKLRVVDAVLEGAGERRDEAFQPAALRAAAYLLDSAILARLIAAGAGSAARTPAEERLWKAAAKLSDPRPLALLIWFGGSINYLPEAERRQLEEALPGLTAERLRPYVVRAAEQRERAWDAVLARDLPTLEQMLASGMDLDERHGETALSRAAVTDVATVRWLLAHGARAKTRDRDDISFGCTAVGEGFGVRKPSRAQVETFTGPCNEALDKSRPRPAPYFAEHALETAVRNERFDIAEALAAVSDERAALASIVAMVARKSVTSARFPLFTRLTAIAVRGRRIGLSYELQELLERGDFDAAAAMLDAFVPANREEVSIALTPDLSEKRCSIEAVDLLRRYGAPVAEYRNWEEGNLFALAVTCDSPDLVAAAAATGLPVNHVSRIGVTALERVPWEKRTGPTARALESLGARPCSDLFDKATCSSGGIEPDPAL